MKKALSLALVVLMVVTACAVFAVSSSADDTWSWKVEEGVLTISGTGAMTDYRGNEAARPWIDQKDSITEVVVEDGITSIGSSSFTEMKQITKITFGKDVTKVGMDAFSYDDALTEVIFNGPLTEVGQGICWSSGNIKNVTITGQTVDEFKAVLATKNYNDNLTKATITVAGEVEPPSEDGTKLGGYIVAAGHSFEYVDGQVALAYDFDVNPVVSKDFWENKDNYTFTVTFTAEDGTVLESEEKTPLKAVVYNDAGTDTSLWFSVTKFTPAAGQKYGMKVVIAAKDGSVKYWVEEGGVAPRFGFKKVDDNAKGTFAGKDGATLSWKIDKETKTLVISGTGAMEDFEDVSAAPWADYGFDIAGLRVKGGVTRVGKNTAPHTPITVAVFEEGVEEVAMDTIAYCESLTAVYFPKTLKKIGQGVAYGSKALEAVNYAGTEEEFNAEFKTADGKWKTGSVSPDDVRIGEYNLSDGLKLKSLLKFEVAAPADNTPGDDNPPVVNPPAGTMTVVFVILAVAALFGTALVSKKVFDR